MKMSISEYRFESDNEPDDEILRQLMHEVAIDARIKSEKAMEKLHETIKSQVSDVLKREGIIHR